MEEFRQQKRLEPVTRVKNLDSRDAIQPVDEPAIRLFRQEAGESEPTREDIGRGLSLGEDGAEGRAPEEKMA